MITATEAREILANSEKAQTEELETIEIEIRKLAAKGNTILQYHLPSVEWVDPLASKLEKLGFTCHRHPENKWIQIEW